MSVYEFLEKNSIYLVLIIALIVWFSVFVYLIRVDVKLKKLEDEFSKIENQGGG